MKNTPSEPTEDRTNQKESLSEEDNVKKQNKENHTMNVTKKAGAMSRGRKLPYWELVDIDRLVKNMAEVDELQEWFDIVDELLDPQDPIITPHTKVILSP